MALVLTHIYLEKDQRTELERMAKKNKSNLSVEVRSAVDIYKTGISAQELEMLDETTRIAQANIEVMNATLDIGLMRASKFFADIEKVRAAQ
ncbi:MAG TPA: hypothetical protein VIE65_13020 [Methylobacter sp.]|jgi:hypothetical protein